MAQADWPWALLLILISPAVGSFLGVLVDRLVVGLPVVARPSSCAACGARLAWRDMVPVLSALALGFRCRGCGAPIPDHLIRIELVATLVALISAALVPCVVPMWLSCACLWCLTALFYSDLLHMRLPDRLTTALLVLGMALAVTDPGRGWAEGLISAAVGAGSFWLLRVAYQALRGREGLGLGDVRLMAGIGAAVGWAELPAVTLLAALLALAVAGVEALEKKSLPRGDTRVPFGSYLAAAAAVFVVL